VLKDLQDRLLLFNTGASHNSWQILKQQDSETRKNGSHSTAALHELKSFAEQMRSALGQGNLRDFALLLDEAWKRKKRVAEGVSNDRIDHLYTLAKDCGAVGGKITGAGGGGFLLLYCEPEHQGAVRSAFNAQHIREMKFAFDFNGAKVLVNDPFLETNGASSLHRGVWASGLTA
jgi:D-glycero-alpha-D-manno-heptose-7-phosphate kinase